MTAPRLTPAQENALRVLARPGAVATCEGGTTYRVGRAYFPSVIYSLVRIGYATGGWTAWITNDGRAYLASLDGDA